VSDRRLAVHPVKEIHIMILKQLAFAAAITASTVITLPAHAVVVAQWNFNSPIPDDDASTGWSLPSVGLGSTGLFGGPSSFWASAAGSSDPTHADDSAWFTRPYKTQGTGDKASGVAFNVSTAGLTSIVFSWDQWVGAAASKYVQLLYRTSDGAPFQEIPGALFSATLGGNTWYSRSVNLSNLPEVENTASLWLAIAPTYAPNSMAYEAASPDFAYGPYGVQAFDLVTITGQVPEPTPLALFLVGAGALGLLIRARGTAPRPGEARYRFRQRARDLVSSNVLHAGSCTVTSEAGSCIAAVTGNITAGCSDGACCVCAP